VGRKVLLGLGCLLVIAAAIGIAFLARRGNDSPEIAVLVTSPPAPVLERVEDLAARVPAGGSVALRARPNGKVLATVPARTEFGSRQTLAVAFRRGDWIAVRSPALGNRKVGWVRRKPLRLVRRPILLEVDLSRRALLVREESRVLRTISIAIGAPDTPTPIGRFYVTDKLRGADFGSYYGCCILALSGRQPNLPDGWSGGDRLAIHGSPTPTWGEAVSNGCLHATEADLRYLTRTVPLGTTVRIHA
jgi:lipoprotein-anchoring transpeptidase ErfK/SrfK